MLLLLDEPAKHGLLRRIAASAEHLRVLDMLWLKNFRTFQIVTLVAKTV